MGLYDQGVPQRFPVNIVLLEPEIHFNTGNIGRTCVGTGTTLHLVEPLGFSLGSAQIRRSGLDYWKKLDLKRHPDFAAFLTSIPSSASLYFFSAEGPRSYWEAEYREDGYLIFGKESAGLSPDIRSRYRDRLFRVPHSGEIRSLNLGTAAAVALYEAIRQTSKAPPP